METDTAGRVVTEAKIENLEDRGAIEPGLKSPDEARAVAVEDALVDTGATLLSLPSERIRRPGLSRAGTRRVRSGGGGGEAARSSADRLTIRGRSRTMDVLQVPDGTPVPIGQSPRERLDFVDDPRDRTLDGNPAHGGEHIYELD